MSKKFRRRQQLEEIGNCFFFLKQSFSTNISLVKISFSRTAILKLEMSVCMSVLKILGET